MLQELIYKLARSHSLNLEEYEKLITGRDEESARLLRRLAVQERVRIYGYDVYIRGLIEISNICRNDCYYCGIRHSNTHCERYRLTPEQIISCTDEGYKLGFRTFVLQGGEDSYFTDEILCELIREIKRKHSDCAITLSLGERSRASYEKLKQSGADRYLLRHETADKDHYSQLHPENLSYDNRMNCLQTLRELHYQVGAGFMVGSPFQTSKTLAEDLKFIETFKPEMCGIGPFIPHKDTPFRDYEPGTVELTCYLLSIIRLIHPAILLPATTALGTIDKLGREKGILSGANVVMPNLSPVDVRKKYELYDNKICTGEESAQCKSCLEARMNSIGYKIAVTRGDIKMSENVLIQNVSSVDEIMIVTSEMLKIFFETLKFTVSLFEEEDGSVTGTLEELDLIENAPSKESCLISLLEAMKEYAHDFYNDFTLWSSAPNRKRHIPYVLKIISSSDSQLLEDMICRNGKN